MEERLANFLGWCEENGVRFHGCTVKPVGDAQGFGVYTGDQTAKDVLMATPLSLSLTPLTVLRDSRLGVQYQEMLENDVDDRLLVMTFLMIERARGKESFWAPYLDMLPTEFGTPLWFTDEELMQLEGTTLFHATKAQLRSLRRVFEKVKPFAEAAMSSINMERTVEFKDFLWANCIFWTRALNIPWPASFLTSQTHEINSENDGETIWIEGLVPGIDFCNHARKPCAVWEVDGKDGSTSGVPNSMYLVTGSEAIISPDSEICINYGNKGNEELLFLYGFVEEDNPDDYVMLHFPKEFMDQDSLIEYKLQLLEQQDLTLRWLLPRSLLADKEASKRSVSSGYSWSGHRKPPAYLDSLVYPEQMVSAFRTLAMSEGDLQSVSSLLEELTHEPSKDDIKAAVWEVCGDMQAFSLIVNILSTKMDELQRGSGTESQDEEVLGGARDGNSGCSLSQNHRASVIYRKGQKYLVSSFLKESELVLAK